MIDRYLGLCMAAGGVKTGFDTVLGEIRAGRAKLVIVSADASERTQKQLSDKCTYYGVKLYHSEMTGGDIAQKLGKKNSCVAIALNGKGPWKNVQSAFDTAERSL